MTVYVVGAAWDERRNSSRTFAPAPGAARDAVRACRELRARHPELVAWIEAGAPRLTELEHTERFGMPYRRGKL